MKTSIFFSLLTLTPAALAVSQSVFDFMAQDDQLLFGESSTRPYPPPRISQGSIMDSLRQDERFSKLVDLIESHRGLRDDLDKNKKMTLFAPTNEAFHHLKEMKSQGNDYDMADILRYHMSSQEWSLDEMTADMTIKTDLKLKELDNEYQRIRVFKHGDCVVLNMYSRLSIKGDIEAKNGFVHAIDRVLLPPVNLPQWI